MAKFNFRDKKNIVSDTDSGFGNSYQGSGERVLNSKGDFNVERIGKKEFSIFHELLELNWSHTLLLIIIFYIIANFIFACLYYALGSDALEGMKGLDKWADFLQCYFFSVQTFTTVGYGVLHPKGIMSSTIAGLEALSGLLTFAIITGLVYSKFSKPQFKIRYSDKLIISPFKDITGAMFRVVNPHRQKLMDVEASMIFVFFPDDSNNRQFRTLELEIKKVSMFPVSWTINHPITPESPMFGLTKEDFARMKVEMLVMLSAYDEESGRIIKNLSSYHYSQFECNVKFDKMVDIVDGKTILYLDKVSNIVRPN